MLLFLYLYSEDYMHSGEILSKFFFMPDAGHLIMVCIGFFFIYLAISRKIETALFLPFGFGIILMNIPGSDGAEGIFKLLYETGILNGEVLPLLLFLGFCAAHLNIYIYMYVCVFF